MLALSETSHSQIRVVSLRLKLLLKLKKHRNSWFKVSVLVLRGFVVWLFSRTSFALHCRSECAKFVIRWISEEHNRNQITFGFQKLSTPNVVPRSCPLSGRHSLYLTQKIWEEIGVKILISRLIWQSSWLIGWDFLYNTGFGNPRSRFYYIFFSKKREKPKQP